MNKNLLFKTVLIIAVLLFFLFGIFGVPSSFAPQGLLAALQKRIHLGLDLKGGAPSDPSGAGERRCQR